MSVATVLGAGAARAVVGTAALRDPAVAGRLDRRPRHRSRSRSRSTSARAWRSGRAGAPAPPAFAQTMPSSRSRTRASRPSRSPRSTVTACSAARTSSCWLGWSPGSWRGHRLGRHRLARRHPRGPRARLCRCDRRARALRGSVRHRLGHRSLTPHGTGRGLRPPSASAVPAGPVTRLAVLLDDLLGDVRRARPRSGRGRP